MQSLFPDKTIGKLLDHICAVGGQSHSPDSRGPRKKKKASVYPRVRLDLWLHDRGRHSPALREPLRWSLAGFHERAILDTLFGPCFGSVAWPSAGANEHGAARVKLTLCTQCCL